METMVSGQVKRRGRPKGTGMDRTVAAKRATNMAQLYRSGRTLEEVGAVYGISRERVRQILKLYYGFNRHDGGERIKQQQREQQRAAISDAKMQARHGISRAEWKAHVAQYGASTVNGSPLNAFVNQRRTMMGLHGIPWELTFAEWWEVWQKSGLWEIRQQARRRDSYCLARRLGSGGFTKDNVCIKTIANAARDYQMNRPDRDTAWKRAPFKEGNQLWRKAKRYQSQ